MARLGRGLNGLNHLAYGRYFLSELLPNEVDRCIYLDMDVLILGNLEELPTLLSPGKAVAAIEDGGLRRNPQNLTGTYWGRHLLQLNLPIRNTGYFNSGVLVLSLDLWRAQSLSRDLSEARNSLLKRGLDPALEDQDILNVHLGKSIQPLPEIWNFFFHSIDEMSDKTDIDPEKSIRILHFAGAAKPWKSFAWAGYFLNEAIEFFESAASRSANEDEAVSGKSLAKALRLLADAKPATTPRENADIIEALQQRFLDQALEIPLEFLLDKRTLLNRSTPLVNLFIVDGMHEILRDPELSGGKAFFRAWRHACRSRIGRRWARRRLFLRQLLNRKRALN
jgi:lipopolysaccharide biosynthesis glycosyltransferase